MRLADLLEMDLAGTASTGPEGLTHGAKYGDHISAAFQDHYRGTIAGLLASRKPYDSDFLDALDAPFARVSGSPASFEQACNANNRLGTAEEVWGKDARAVRYLPLKSFLQYFLRIDTARDLPPLGNPSRSAEARNTIEARKSLLSHPTGLPSDLGNPRNGRVWVTYPTVTAPHQSGPIKGLDGPALCSYIVRRMGLPDYHELLMREDKIGLVALEYPLDATVYLYRPTVADALSAPVFFPAPKGCAHGETLPLTDSLRDTEARSVRGEREWIHANYKAVLVEVASAPRTCSLIWYGTW